MNTQQITSFLVLCETLNYSKAAKLTHISQSVISRHIQQLEEELGFMLFSRTRHSVLLTDAGAIMRNHFSSSRKELYTAVQMATRVADPGMSGISIRLLDLFDNRIILDTIGTFQKTSFHVERYSTPCHAADILSGRYDIGIGYAYELAEVPGIAYREIKKSRDNLICAKNYIPPKKGLPSIYMVSDNMRDPANMTNERAETLGVARYRLRLLPNMASVLTAVESCMGYTTIKDFSIPYIRFEINKIMLNSWQSVGLAWADDPKRPHIQEFVDACFGDTIRE